MKVRHTTRCAGGCGVWLTVGQEAVRRHRGTWCLDCYARHAERCQRCRDDDARAAARRPGGSLF